MNLTYFRPKMRGNVENKNNNPVNIRFVDKTWDTRNLSENITCHFNISQVATLVSMIPNLWCSLEVAAAELRVCLVIKGDVWWNALFFRRLLSLDVTFAQEYICDCGYRKWDK